MNIFDAGLIYLYVASEPRTRENQTYISRLIDVLIQIPNQILSISMRFIPQVTQQLHKLKLGQSKTTQLLQSREQVKFHEFNMLKTSINRHM